ncbi:MAG TPA: ABC transporter permease, partial [Candidatus Limnocylindrales bacterium]|nr:ABC transporter permease [Candidatus Limnocylindrales bacterium]
MRKTMDIALHELRLIFMDRSIWLNLVVIPVVISFAVGLANGALMSGGGSGPVLRVDVLNNDAGPQGAALLESMRAINTNLLLCPQDNTDDDPCGLGDAALTPELIQDRLISQASLALILIPEGFSARLDAGENSSLIYRSNDNAAAPGYILQALQAAAQAIGGAQTAANVGVEVADSIDFLTFRDDIDRTAFAEQVRASAATAWETPPARVDYVSTQSGTPAVQGSGFNQSIPGIASMYVMFAIFPAAAVLIRERKLGTFQRVLMMPVHRWELLGGKMSARFVVGMIQYAVIFTFGLFLGVRYGGAPFALIVLMASF